MREYWFMWSSFLSSFSTLTHLVLTHTHLATTCTCSCDGPPIQECYDESVGPFYIHSSYPEKEMTCSKTKDWKMK
jgi:hypothetical protein